MSFPNPQPTVLEYVSPVRPLYVGSSLQSAIDVMRLSGIEAVAVVDGSFLVGVVWSADMRRAVLAGASASSAVEDLLDASPPTVAANASVAEARALLADSHAPLLVVVDGENRYVGMLPALSLAGPVRNHPAPHMVGGMATPFGVFLTNGEVSGGAGPLALASTGALLFAAYFVATIAVWLCLRAFAGFPTEGVVPDWQVRVFEYAPVALFLLLIRASPIAGTHAAEHMVVHAIERNEPLVPEAVSRMPRVHPRCGTNIAVGAMLFMALLAGSYQLAGEAGPLLALAATVLTWRRVGAIVQHFVTTKRPNRRQVEGAISAANELLDRYKHSNRLAPSFARRLMHSGLPWVLLGSIAVASLAAAISWAAGIPLAVW
jgi:hypothetical protein